SFYCFSERRDHPPFPTRRSSDLLLRPVEAGVVRVPGIFGVGGLAAALVALHVPAVVLVRVLGLFVGAAAGAEVVGEVLFAGQVRSEEHTSELQSREKLVCRLLLE